MAAMAPSSWSVFNFFMAYIRRQTVTASSSQKILSNCLVRPRNVQAGKKQPSPSGETIASHTKLVILELHRLLYLVNHRRTVASEETGVPNPKDTVRSTRAHTTGPPTETIPQDNVMTYTILREIITSQARS